MGKMAASPPSPLSALRAANKVASAMEAGPGESFVNANGSDWSKSSADVECLRPASTGRFWPRRSTARTTLNEGRRNDRRKRVA
jgi:hypothetical protein